MTLNRRTVLRGAALAAPAALFLGCPRQVRAAEHTLKFAHGYPSSHPVHVAAVAAADRIAKESDGRVAMQVFGNAQLGGDTQMLSQVRSGAIQVFSTGGLFLSSFVQVAALNGVGFAFTSYDGVWTAMDGPVGDLIRSGFAKAGLHAFEKCWDSGFRNITSSTHPIATPADLVGFKIRVPVSPLLTSLFQALKAAPTSLNFPEVYSALQTKIVEGQENPLVLAQTARFYEVQKFVSMTNHIWDGCWVLGNGAAWAALPNDVKALVEGAIDQAGLDQRAAVAAQNATVIAEMKKEGLLFNDIDAGPFRAALQAAGFYKYWQEKFGAEAWAALEKSAPGLGG